MTKRFGASTGAPAARLSSNSPRVTPSSSIAVRPRASATSAPGYCRQAPAFQIGQAVAPADSRARPDAGGPVRRAAQAREQPKESQRDRKPPSRRCRAAGPRPSSSISPPSATIPSAQPPTATAPIAPARGAGRVGSARCRSRSKGGKAKPNSSTTATVSTLGQGNRPTVGRRQTSSSASRSTNPK